MNIKEAGGQGSPNNTSLNQDIIDQEHLRMTAGHEAHLVSSWENNPGVKRLVTDAPMHLVSIVHCTDEGVFSG